MTKVVIITGASRGLGLALSTVFAGAGWQPVVTARTATDLAATEKALHGHGLVLPGDVADPAHRRALVAAAESLGGPDLLINNAATLGPAPLPPLATYPLDGLRDALEVNVVAPLALTQLALPALRRTGGAVINLTSDAAVETYEGWGGYGASKAALDLISGVLAVEEPTIRVWWVDPGSMRTRMLADAGEDLDEAASPEEIAPGFLRLVTARPPSGRITELPTLSGTSV